MGRCLSNHYLSWESKKLIVRFLRYSLKDSKYMRDFDKKVGRRVENVGRRVENEGHRVRTSVVSLD